MHATYRTVLLLNGRQWATTSNTVLQVFMCRRNANSAIIFVKNYDCLNFLKEKLGDEAVDQKMALLQMHI